MAMKKQSRSAPILQNMKPYSKANEPIKFLSEKEMTKQKKDRIKSWVTFYRKNPSFFVEHYMDVPLYPYQ